MISRKIILVSSSKKLIKIYQLKHFEKCEKISFLYIELLPCWKGWKRLMWTHWIFVDPFWVWPQKARENSGATKIKWRNVRVSPMAHALMHLSLSLSPSKTYYSNFKISPDHQTLKAKEIQNLETNLIVTLPAFPVSFILLCTSTSSYTVIDLSFYFTYFL